MSENSPNTTSTPEDTTNKKEDYRIEICKNGEFAVTFDTGKNEFRY